MSEGINVSSDSTMICGMVVGVSVIALAFLCGVTVNVLGPPAIGLLAPPPCECRCEAGVPTETPVEAPTKMPALPAEATTP